MLSEGFDGGVGLAAREVGFGGTAGRPIASEQAQGVSAGKRGLGATGRRGGWFAGNLATLLRTRASQEGEERLESRGRRRGGGRSRACEGSRGCSRAPGRQ